MNDIDEVEYEVDRSTLVLRLSGVLDHAGSAATASELNAALRDRTPRTVVIDLRGLRLATAAGTRVLDRFAEELAVRGTQCRLVAEPGSGPARTLHSVGLDSGLPIFDTVEHAIAETQPPTPWLTPLTSALLAAPTVTAAMRHVVSAATAMIPHALAVSVTVRAPGGTYFTPATSGPVALELDDAQYRSGRGPCVDTADPAGPAVTLSDDLQQDRRWPQFTSVAAKRGVGAVLSTTLLPAAGSRQPAAGDRDFAGALNVYSARQGLVEIDRVRAQLLATHASLAMARTRAMETNQATTAQLQQAIASRDVIGQAKGILMSTPHGYSADQAFDVLCHASQDLNIKVSKSPEQWCDAATNWTSPLTPIHPRSSFHRIACERLIHRRGLVLPRRGCAALCW